ncbi:MAG: S-layer homology domain-containing protein [Clostridiales bacterium]|nr:S-layer homology domain-containing protein [Clostridiales bacterium]
MQSAIKVRIYVHGATAPANKDKNSGQGGQNPTDGSPGLPGEPNHTPEPDTPIQTAHRFTDLDGYDWARDAIVDLAEQDIIKGTGMNTFSPAANIKRADFTVLLVRALKLDSNSADNFDDVKASDYFANELAIAKANGIVTGIGGNRFNPGGEITRQDMMVIAARALEKAGVKLEAATQEDLELFKDASDISDYAKDAVAILTKNGIVKGVNGLINPSGKTTRAEVAVLIRRILDLLQ